MQLTRRQKQILDAINALTESRGFPPTIREVGEHVGLSSSSTIHEHLQNLKRLGAVEWDRRQVRTLRVK